MVGIEDGGNLGLSYSDRPLSLLHPLIFIMVPKENRGAVTSLWQLDQSLAQQIRSVREPTLRAMRLLWWQEQLSNIAAGGEVTGHPLLEALARHLDRPMLDRLTRLPEIWGDFVEAEPLDIAHIKNFAIARGGLLFWASANLMQSLKINEQKIETLGKYWALVDVATHLTDGKMRALVWAELADCQPNPSHLPKPLSALSILSTMRKRNRGAIKPLSEQLRLLRFSLTGT